MKFYFFFLVFFFTKIISYLHLKLDILCDDYCKDILIDGISIKDEINLDTESQYYLRTIEFTANPNQIITFSTWNEKAGSGIAVRIIIKSNGDNYIYNTTLNEDLFTCNVTNSMIKREIDLGTFYSLQNDSLKELYKELEYIYGPEVYFQYQYIDFYFTIPNIDDEYEFNCENIVILISQNYLLNISDFIIDSNNIKENYNFLYFTQDDNEELIGKFYFQNSGTEIKYKEFYEYEEIIKYNINNKYYYEDKIIYHITHNYYLVPNEFAYIKFTVCPNYCLNCYENKICESIYNDNELDEEFLENTSKKYYNQIIKSTETEDYLLTSTNNFFQNDLYSQPDLNYCETLLKNYFNLDYLNISVVYIEEDSSKKINKIIIYNSDYSIITILTSLSICSIENIFYDESTKTILECYETCKTCSGTEINNCNSCYDNKILTSINTCVNVYEQCGNKKTLWLFEAIENGNIECLTTSNCPSIAINVISETLECVNSCDNINSNLNCINCNKGETQIYNSCVDLSDSEKSLEIIQENILKLLESNPLINYGNKTYYISEYSSSSSIQTNLSEINLGECESILKNKYGISDNEKLILLQIETKIEGQATSNVEYYVYSPNGTLLDLSVCSNIDITITKVITDTSNLNLDTAKSLAEQGVDIYNINDDFFNNFCNGISVYNQDLTLENRIDDVYVNVSFCDDGCEYQGINLDTYKVICSCTNEETNSIQNTTTTKNKNKFLKVIDDLLDNINYKIVVCYKYWLNVKYFKNNGGFYFSVIIFVILQILIIINCCKWYKITLKKLKEDINKINLKRINDENLMSRNYDSPNHLNNTKYYISSSSKRNMMIPKINKNFLFTENNIDSELSQNIQNQNKIGNIEYEEINKKMIEMNNIKTPIYNYFFYSPIKNKKNGNKNKNHSKKNSTTNTELELITSNNTNKNEKNIYSNSEENINTDNLKKENKKDIDYDELNYFEALIQDKRKFINIVWHSALCKIDIIAIFIHIGKYEYFPILISVYLYSLTLDFTVNALLFSDDIISSKYKNGGKLKFWESWILSVSSNIVCKILTNSVCALTQYNDNFELIIEQVNKKKKQKKYSILFLNKARKKIIIYFIIQNILMLFFIYYLNIFCALYSQSQVALFNNYLLGSLNSLLYSLGFALLISIFRFISLNYHKKRCFLISKYLENNT